MLSLKQQIRQDGMSMLLLFAICMDSTVCSVVGRGRRGAKEQVHMDQSLLTTHQSDDWNDIVSICQTRRQSTLNPRPKQSVATTGDNSEEARSGG